MARVYDNYSSLIDFTRASSGTALRPISYGDELVSNGTFDSDTSGWTAVDCTLSISSQELQITASQNFGRANQSFSTVIGKLYSVSGKSTFVSGTNRSYIAKNDDGASLNAVIAGSGTSDPAGDKSFLFIATSTTTYISLGVSVNGSVANFDNVSIREVLFDQPNGTLTLFNHPTNVPRIEYDADGNRLGLLVEESRSNLITYSEDFSNVYWTKQSSVDSVEDGNILGPNGLVSGTKVTTNDVAYVSKDSIYFTQNITVTFSAFLKAGSITTVGLHYAQDLGDALNDNCDFDLSNGTVSSQGSASTAKIEYVGNGWYRCSNTYTTNGTGTALGVRFVVQGAGTFYVYGAQLEAGSFPTSYIPTSGSTATRSADVASIGVSEFGYNQSEGTLFVDFDMKYTESGSGFPRVVEIATESNNADRIKVQLTESTGALNAQAFVNFSVQGSVNLGSRTGGSLDSTKVAFAFREDDFAASDNGNTAVTDTSGTFAPSVGRDTLAIGKQTNSSSNFVNGHIKSIKYYPRRLTNAQLEELTS